MEGNVPDYTTMNVVPDFVFDKDDVVIKGELYREFARKMHCETNRQELKMVQSQQIQCLYEAREWLMSNVDKMNLAEKDVFIVIGASRTGKGTLLSALSG